MPEHCLVSHQLVPAIRRLRPRGTITLGRDLGCDVPLPSEHISRRHAELTWHLSGAFVIRDRSSKNGTRVNGVPVLTPQVLKDGDTIEVGPFSFRFRAIEGSMADLLGSEIEGAETAGLDQRGHAAGPDPAGHARLAFAGDFSSYDLLEVCRVIAAGARTGTLTVTGGGLEGQISFERGAIHRARVGDQGGIEAAHVILAIVAGRFEFAEGPIGLTPNCRLKAEPLIMEVARRLDQAAPRVRVAAPGEVPAPRPAGMAQTAEEAEVVPLDDTCTTVKLEKRKDGGQAMSAPLMDEAPLLDESPPGR